MITQLSGPTPASVAALWNSLDELDAGPWWRDTQEEEEAFRKRVSKEIELKLAKQTALNNPIIVARAGSNFSRVRLIERSDKREVGNDTRICDTPLVPSSPSTAPSLASHSPSFIPLLFPAIQLPSTSQLCSTPPHPSQCPMSIPTQTQTATPLPSFSLPLPTFSTPNLPQGLPNPPLSNAPDARSYRRNVDLQDTPENIPTPTQTPIINTSRAGAALNGSVGRGPRDDPATPVPLGNDAFSKLRGKREFQKLTEHFQKFTKTATVVNNQLAAPAGAMTGVGDCRSRGKGPENVVVHSMLGLGRSVFKGFRFCIPPETHQVAKHKQRWDIIAKLGGTVVLQPDTAITHVIHDSGRSAALLARDLGLHALSELPEGTICVKWDWVSQCKLSGKILDTTPWLSFPPTTFSRTVSAAAAPRSRITDITHQFVGDSSAIRRKREPTATDSETESSEQPSFLPTRPRFHRAVASDPVTPQSVTRHAVSVGPGWANPARGEEDALDVMISGVKNGMAEFDNVSASESDSPSDDEIDIMGTQTGNPNPLANKFKCGQSHAGQEERGPNEWLAVKFIAMHDMYEGIEGKNEFSIRGYQRAAGIMRRTPYPIKSGAQARLIKGIGEGMAERIDEFISGGPGRAFYEDTEKARAIAILKNVYGVGKSFANELYRRGARTIDDLRTKNYGLTEGQKIGVQLYDDLCSRMPRDECRRLFELIRDAAHSLDRKLRVEVMGSYRRGQETSGDVDILITRDTTDGFSHTGILRRLVTILHATGVITHDLSTPHEWGSLEAKWMGVGRVSLHHKYRRIDILCVPFEQWGAAVLYFTGNDVFNRSLRLYARKKGYSLNQRGLYRGVWRSAKGNKMTEGEIIASRTEQEIFDILGVRWRPPHQRRP